MANLKALKAKKKNYQVNLKTQLTGKVKDAFLDDCIDQEEKEAVVARDIIREHYDRKNKY